MCLLVLNGYTVHNTLSAVTEFLTPTNQPHINIWLSSARKLNELTEQATVAQPKGKWLLHDIISPTGEHMAWLMIRTRKKANCQQNNCLFWHCLFGNTGIFCLALFQLIFKVYVYWYSRSVHTDPLGLYISSTMITSQILSWSSQTYIFQLSVL